jgi:hypothetical protein
LFGTIGCARVVLKGYLEAEHFGEHKLEPLKEESNYYLFMYNLHITYELTKIAYTNNLNKHNSYITYWHLNDNSLNLFYYLPLK